MSEFRFPAPRGDVFNEVTFDHALKGLAERTENTSLLNLVARLRAFPGGSRGGAAPPHLGEIPKISCRSPAFLKHDYTFKNSDVFDGDIPFGEVLPWTNEHFGHMYYPTSAVRGLVVMTHGQLGGPTSFHDIYRFGFNYLLCSLATSGFVAVSIQSSISAEERVNIMRLHLRWLVEKAAIEVGIKEISKKPLVLIGHSEAGASVVRLASQISSGLGPRNSKGDRLYSSVAAVIGIHPGGEGAPELTTTFADSYLAFAGSHDGDSGVGPDGGVKQVERAVRVNRHLVYVHGASHTGWCDPNYASAIEYSGAEVNVDPLSRISPRTQTLVLRTYIGLFLEGVIGKNPTAMRVFLGGQQPILASSDPGVLDDIKKRLLVRPYYRRKRSTRVPIAGSESYTFFGFLDKIVTFGPAEDVGNLCVQNGNVFRLRWNTAMTGGPKPVILISLDKINPLSVLSATQTNKIFLEFDTVQSCHVPWNNPNQTVGLVVTLMLQQGQLSCPPVPIPPSKEIDTKVNLADRTRTVLSTFRIPLISFGAIAWTLPLVKYVAVQFEDVSPARDILLSLLRVVVEP